MYFGSKNPFGKNFRNFCRHLATPLASFAGWTATAMDRLSAVSSVEALCEDQTSKGARVQSGNSLHSVDRREAGPCDRQYERERRPFANLALDQEIGAH